MAKSNDVMGSGSINLAKNVSVLTSITDKSLKNPARLGLIGGLLWLVVMLFYFVNDSLTKPFESYSVFVVSDILNIVGAFLLFLFIRFLYKQGIHFGLKKLMLLILAGFTLRLLGKMLDAFNYALIDLQVGSDALIAGIFLLSDLFHLLGAIAIAVLMLIFLKKEQKSSYKVICFLNVFFASLYACVYIFLFLLDAGIIESLYIQLTRLVSLFTSITLILYFSVLLKDSRKMQRKEENTLDI
ncbi:hypothetical protein [Niallia nealsonii]|uniref:Uncharacterized protein n=1 Tax=Niallia nealsonii TaxID=115979 RepID=A0A2N0Z6X7_9BACI|nr:hypothetical protein [Niallia nealsonii]PKG25275.1 hypothetical protein CWS01_02020 [Niallia nealsonii]